MEKGQVLEMVAPFEFLRLGGNLLSALLKTLPTAPSLD